MKRFGFVGLAALAAFVGMLIGGVVGTGDALALPKSMRDYAARKLFFPSGTTANIVLPANDTTALSIGDTANPDFIVVDTGTGTETWIVSGTTGQKAFDVPVGTATFTEAVTLGAGMDMTGDLTCSGGVGALTFDDSASSIVVPDDDASALDIGAAGATRLLRLNTTDDQEALIVTGYAGVDSLHVDVGDTQLDEDLTIGAGAAGVDYTLTMNGEDNDLTCTWDEDNAILAVDSGMTVGTTLGVTGLVTASGGLTSTAGTNTINDITPNVTTIDFTAEHQVPFFAKTTGAIMTEVDTQEDYFRVGPLNTYFEIFQDGNNSDCVGSWGDGITGWVLPGPNAADQGFQLTEGIALGSAKSFTAQTDTMTMRVAFLVSTRAELDVLQAGFRKLGSYAVGDDEAEWTAAYDDKVTVGIFGNAGVIDQATSVATSDVSTACTHAAAADGDILALQIEVDASGDTTVSIGTDTPAGGTAAQTRTSVTAAYADLTEDTLCNAASVTLTAAEYVPTIALAKAAGGVSTTTIVDYYVGP